MSLPFYTPPTEKERLDLQASLPFSVRRGLRAKPMNIGLWNEDQRNQIDLLDWLRKEEGKGAG